MHSPWAMIPGSPASLATSSSRWIGIGSPDGGRVAERLVVVDVLRRPWPPAPARAASRRTCAPGRSSPTVSPASKPRKNAVMYCSLTSSPSAVRHSSTIAARVPFASPAKPISLARVTTSLSPGRIGRWKWKSCSPCTTRRSDLERHHLDRRLQQSPEHRDDREHRRRDVARAVRLDRVVGRRRVLGEPLPGDLEPLVVGPAVQRRCRRTPAARSSAAVRPTSSRPTVELVERLVELLAPSFSTALPSAPTIICALELAAHVDIVDPLSAGSTVEGELRPSRRPCRCRTARAARRRRTRLDRPGDRVRPCPA